MSWSPLHLGSPPLKQLYGTYGTYGTCLEPVYIDAWPEPQAMHCAWFLRRPPGFDSSRNAPDCNLQFPMASSLRMAVAGLTILHAR